MIILWEELSCLSSKKFNCTHFLCKLLVVLLFYSLLGSISPVFIFWIVNCFSNESPTYGHSLFPNFGNPFRMVSPNRSSDQSAKLNRVLNAFEDSLTRRLKQLEPKMMKDMINLSWMQLAMGVLSATHADLKSLITDLQFPVTEWDEKWMDEYLDDTVKLLDICLALNVEISKLEHFQLLVHYVLHLLDFSDGVWSNDKLFRAKGSLQELKEKMALKGKNGVNSQRNSKIENCSVILQRMSKSLQFGKVKSSSKGRVFLRAMYGVKATTIFLCSVVASSLSGHPGPLIELRVPDQFLWSTAFTRLQRRINGEIKRCFASDRVLVVKELEMLDAAIKNVHPIVESLSPADIVDGTEKVEQIRIAIQELQQSVQLLAQGLDPLSKQVNDFFHVILSGRNALLDSLRMPPVQSKPIRHNQS